MGQGFLARAGLGQWPGGPWHRGVAPRGSRVPWQPQEPGLSPSPHSSPSQPLCDQCNLFPPEFLYGLTRHRSSGELHEGLLCILKTLRCHLTKFGRNIRAGSVIRAEMDPGLIRGALTEVEGGLGSGAVLSPKALSRLIFPLSISSTLNPLIINAAHIGTTPRTDFFPLQEVI